MTPHTQARDAMQFINEQSTATLGRFIERLEFRAKDPTFTAYREAYLQLIDLPPAAAVLDLVGDAHALDFPAASFDAAVAHPLVSHVRDPLAVLTEAARVTRPGGTVAIFDGDYASLTFGCADARLGMAMEQALQSLIMSSPRVMRELPHLLPKAGLRLDAMQAHVYAEAGSSRFLLNLAETYGPLAASSGLMPAEQVQAWLADQRASAENGTFFAACNYYAYVGARV
jgi:SAM-dependent methyltransferase